MFKMRIIFHALNLEINSWLEYKQQALALGTQNGRSLDLLALHQAMKEQLILGPLEKEKGQVIQEFHIFTIEL